MAPTGVKAFKGARSYYGAHVMLVATCTSMSKTARATNTQCATLYCVARSLCLALPTAQPLKFSHAWGSHRRQKALSHTDNKVTVDSMPAIKKSNYTQ